MTCSRPRRGRSHPTRTTRLIAALVLIGCLTVLSIARGLVPDPAGAGTHQQLGLPPCGLLTLVGYPCPTCGMTTAFSHAVRGKFLSALSVQPAGLVLALAVAASAVASLRVLIMGRGWRLPRGFTPARIALALVAVILLGWMYKVVSGVMDGTLPVH